MGIARSIAVSVSALAATTLAAATLAGTAHAALPKTQCVVQLEPVASMAVMVDPAKTSIDEALAYPLTSLGDAEPGDLAEIARNGSEVTLKVTKKADAACLKLVPQGDPHAHHRAPAGSDEHAGHAGHGKPASTDPHAGH